MGAAFTNDLLAIIPDARGMRETTAVGLIFIDNFDEVMETVEDIGRPLLTALIDRQLGAYAQHHDGVIQKFEKDKYIFIFSQGMLRMMEESEFDVLEKIRNIDAGNKMPVTLSVGIGVGASDETLSRSMERARAAIDLALGRGGDQVLIKGPDKYYCFGGKTKEPETNSRVRARVKAYALSELIKESDSILVMGHKNPDMDCLGAAIGVNKIVSLHHKRCRIVLNEATAGIKLLYKRITALPEYEGDAFMKPDDALNFSDAATLVIVVDTHRPSLTECPELLKKSKKIVVFDHHRKCAEFIENPALNYHEPYASSTSELVTEMIQHLNAETAFEGAEADALLAGITIDTKNFALKTGAKTFETAAFLRRRGADSTRVRLLQQSDQKSYKEKTIAVNNAEFLNDNIAMSVCSGDVENPTLVTAQAADELLYITGVVASFVLCKFGDSVLISARSLGGINVQRIMEKLDGGGHQNAAGAQIKGRGLEDVKEELKSIIINA